MDHKQIVKQRNSARYRKWRRKLLDENPLCALCESEGIISSAEQLDHIVPIIDAPEKFWDESNVQMICTKCHDKKTHAENEARLAPRRGHLWDEFNSDLAEMISTSKEKNHNDNE